MTTAALKPSSNSWTLRLFTMLIWLLVGLCAAYWVFKFATTKTIEATAPPAAPTVLIDSKAIGKLLGATDIAAVKQINTAASTKFVLFGLANSANGQGYALIAVDGKPAKPYRVGSLVADELVLKSISKTGVLLATSLKATEGVTLELPERKPINNPPNNFAAPQPAQIPLPQPNLTAGQPRFPALNPNNANPAAASAAAAVGAVGAVPSAAAAISRFAPRVSSPDGAVAAPAMPVGAVSSVVNDRN